MKWEVLKLLSLKYALTLHFAFELVVVWKSLCSLVRWASGKANSPNYIKDTWILAITLVFNDFSVWVYDKLWYTLKIYLKENE